MVKVDEKNLEKAFEKDDKKVEIPKEQEIAYHQGALNTLVAEREGLIQMIGLVEQRMQGHLQRMEQLGVKIERKKK